MPTVEERLAMLEGRMDGMSDVRTLIASLSDQMNRGFEGLRVEMRDLRGEMNRRFEQVDHRFAQVDRRFEQVDRRFAQVDHRFEQADRRVEYLDGRITTLDGKNDRHFTWLVGLHLTMMVAVIGVLLAAHLR